MILHRLFCVLATFALAEPAWAGRPLSTDDASVQDAGVCQVESWQQRMDIADSTEKTRDLHVAPACGVGAKIEVGVEWVHLDPPVDVHHEVGLQVKTVLPSLDMADWKFGAKANFLRVDSVPNERWESDNYSVTGIATRDLASGLALHLNLGVERERNENNRGLYAAALAWDAAPRWSTFAEVLGDDQTSAVRIIGGRFWAVPDKIGIDLTLGNQAGVADSRFITLGVSFYELGR